MTHNTRRFFRLCVAVSLAWFLVHPSAFVACGGSNDNNNNTSNSNDNSNDAGEEPTNNNEPVSNEQQGKEKAEGPEDASAPPEPTPELSGSCKPEDCKKGPIGDTGPKGEKGDTGDQGPAWSSSFAGFTTTTLNGNNGGWTGLKAKCTAQFSGSHVCSQRELARMLQNGTLPSMTGNAAWVIGSNFSYPNESKIASNCSGWDSDDPSDLGTTIVFKSNSNAFFFSAECNTTRPVACCMD